MKKIGVFFASGNNRSEIIARAMAQGVSKSGAHVALKPSTSHRGRCDFDAAIFYGFAGGLRQVFDDYRKSRSAIYIDLGYWGRRKRTRWDGYHKLAMNSRHPTAYFQSRPHGPERFQEFREQIRSWRTSGRHILVIGMSAKAAYCEGFKPEEWERDTIKRLRALTDRPIVYRPKPNWHEARPIEGSIFGRGPDLAQALKGCHAVVAHHSNAAIDALLAGIPCICPDGVASVLSGHDLTEIESPPMPDGREQFAYDLAWTQWSVEEIEQGLAYRYLEEEGLLG